MVKELKILKHCPTRRLSLEKVIKRLLQLWDALYAYFDKEVENNQAARVLKLDHHLKSLRHSCILSFLVMLLILSVNSMLFFNQVSQCYPLFKQK